MSQIESQIGLCPQCGAAVTSGELACPRCGMLLHVPRLQELSQQAQWLEGQNPIAAAELWRQCLELLPPHSPQAQMLRRRIAGLGGIHPQARVPISLAGAIARTVGSMIVSALVYGFFMESWAFAAGFVLLILVHEMGHVIALRKYGIPSSPPIFLPFVGAVITIPPLHNAKEEAIVGIGGPVLGTVGALVTFGLYRALHHQILLDLAFWGFAINLLNLLPIPPLDGGRVTAAVSPWIWPLGLLALIGMLVNQYIQAGDDISGVSPIFVLILIVAAPRLWRTFRYRERMANYYQIARSASWAIGCSYVLLGAVLLTMFEYAKYLGAQ